MQNCSMQTLEDKNMQQVDLNVVKYCQPNQYHWLAFETNALLSALFLLLTINVFSVPNMIIILFSKST